MWTLGLVGKYLRKDGYNFGLEVSLETPGLLLLLHHW